jgi:hypothetical protein
MKKLMMTLAAALFATAVVAQVTSANVVGYKTITLTNGYNMLACNFDPVGSETNTLDKVIPGTTTGLKGGNSSITADNIMVFDPVQQQYQTYFLWYTTKTTGTPPANANNWKWVSSATVLAGVQLKSGDPFWYRSRNAALVQIPGTFAGQVPTVAKDISITNGYTMIAGNYSADWDPNTKGTNFWATIGAKGGNSSITADNVMIFDAGNQRYETYFLWYTTKTTGTPPANSNNWKWVSSATVVAPTNFVKLGMGAWYRARNPGKFVIPVTAPYSL